MSVDKNFDYALLDVICETEPSDAYIDLSGVVGLTVDESNTIIDAYEMKFADACNASHIKVRDLMKSALLKVIEEL